MNLITTRLILRELRESDLDAIFSLYSDAAFRRYEGSPLNNEEVGARFHDYLARALRQPREQYRLAVTLAPEDALRGYIHLTQNNLSIREWEIGWGMDPALWGRGYAPEAAHAALRFAFGALNAHRVMAFCHADNRASVRVMEKLGMQYEGRLREVRWLDGRWWDELVYSILDREMKEIVVE